MATAVEAYAVDNKRHPREYSTSAYGDPMISGQSVSGIMFIGLSTPIAYISDCWLIDPFPQQQGAIPADEQRYTYHNFIIRRENAVLGKSPSFSHAFLDVAMPYYGAWRLGSIGPDKDYGFKAGINAQINYDATNGTVSLGNIWRGQNQLDGKQYPTGTSF